VAGGQPGRGAGTLVDVLLAGLVKERLTAPTLPPAPAPLASDVVPAP
jgi:hypothetical protein